MKIIDLPQQLASSVEIAGIWKVLLCIIALLAAKYAIGAKMQEPGA